ncbi:MAG: N-acetyltransferase [Methylococcales bacterium]|nr:N-acetyltransferase [Methylococcales bacterium]
MTRHSKNLAFAIAQTADIEQIVDLINSAYRGETSRLGWTTEANLLAGRRTDSAEILGLMQQADSRLLLCRADGWLMGTAHLHYANQQVQIGMLAVRPSAQGMGIGKQLLLAVETHAQQSWPVRRLVMAVISSRQELIEFYQRRGYRRTGIHKPFPLNPALWTPRVEGLSLEILEKQL